MNTPGNREEPDAVISRINNLEQRIREVKRLLHHLTSTTHHSGEL